MAGMEALGTGIAASLGYFLAEVYPIGQGRRHLVKVLLSQNYQMLALM